MISAAFSYAPSSIYSYMASDLGQNVTGLGALTTAFFLGIGPTQLFAGILTARVGAKKTIASGIALGSVSMVLSAIPGQLESIVILRFFTGVGMAFIFAPGVTLITRYYPKGAEGFGIGLFIAAFDLGGLAFIPAMAVLGKTVGWRSIFFSAGILGFIATAILIILVSGEESKGGGLQIRISDLPKVLFDRSLIVIGAACVAIQVGWSTTGSFMVFYLENSFGLAPGTAGEIGSLFLLSALLASAFSVNIRSKIGGKTTLLVAGIISAVGLASMAFVQVIGVAVATLAIGTAAGMGFATSYVLVSQANQSEGHSPLRVSWVNSISLFGGFWTPILFSFVAANYGYSTAWLVTAMTAVPLLLPIFTLKSRGERESVSTSPPSMLENSL
jgi:predicted MFS family arabinose efflux permease